MRALFVAAAAAVGLGALAGPATAETWTHPAGVYSFDKPAGWPVDTPRQVTPNLTNNVAGTANNECNFYVIQRPEWAAASPEAIRRASKTPYTAEQWTSVSNGFHLFDNQAQVQSNSVDETGFWPIQRAQVQSPSGLVHAGVQMRPGLELLAFCLSYDGRDQPALYEGVIRSLATPRDGEWRAAIEAAEAARAAPPPAN